MSRATAIPYWRLSGFYLFYFASLGALVPYWGLYLRDQGYSVAQIGELLAVLMATKIIAPNIWGWIADHTGRRLAIIRLGSLLTLLAFAGVYWADSYAGLLLVMLLFSFFWNATLPQFEAATLALLGEESRRYSAIRLWGSVGFIVAVLLLGSVLEQHSSALLPHVLLALMLAIWVMSLLTPSAGGVPAQQQQSLGQVLRQPAVLALLVVCFLLQASHGPYYAFYTIYMEDHGYQRSAIGMLWALGVIAEILVFLVMHRWLPRYGARRLLLAALLITALRWFIMGTSVNSFGLMFFAQLLHAASFGLYHAVAIHLVHRFFPGRLQGRGLALYSSVSFGAGGAVGALYSGYIWQQGSPLAAYLVAALLCLIAAWLAWRYVRESTAA